MNEKYWKEFYKNKEIAEPSDFAKFCATEIYKENHDQPFEVLKFLEIGAGDGRDTSLFAKDRFDIVAIEPNNNDLETDKIDHCKSTFEYFVASGEAEEYPFDYIYARWFIHAVSEEIEDKLLDFAKDQKATLMLEFRVIGGEKPDDTHERRLIDLEKFTTKLLEKGFVIKHLEKEYGLSKVGDDDPLLARVIAEYND